jgi:GT2 family glycosyltransferase
LHEQPAPPAITAVVLNYNGAEDTIACVASLRQCSYRNLSILVVDNRSSDGSFARLRQDLEGVEVIQTDRNLGFAGGNNVGIRHALGRNPKYVLILNNDTIVTPEFLEPLVAASETDPRVGATGGTVCYHPSTERIWYGGGRFVWWRGSSFTDHVGDDVDVVCGAAPREVSFITGCLMLIRSDVLRTAGLFDERFFMYSEDAELSLRLLKCGHKLVYVPESMIYHKVQHHGTTPFTLYYGTRNRLLLVRLTLGGLKKFVAYLYLCAVVTVKGLYWMVTRRELARAVFAGVSDFRSENYAVGRGLSYLKTVSP